MAQPTIGIAITADDKTAKGVASAEKRLGTIPKHVSSANKAAAAEIQRTATAGSRCILRTFAQVEQASARAFGGRSVSSGLTSRLGAVREAAAAAGSGFGEAATAGGLLEGALGAVGVAGAATVGILAAAGYAAFKLADGWAKGAASIGRTAEIIGVASKQLQEFNAAAERQGVDKGTATSAAAGLSQTLNDARYGRNNDAVALLARWGVKLQLNKDGSVDTAAMLPQIADAISRRNSSGRRTAARILGIPDAALPAFTQGGAKLSADMKDADGTAYIATPGEIETAKRIQGKEAIVGQMKDRAIARAGAATATGGEGALDAAISVGRRITSGSDSISGAVQRTFAPAASAIGQAARKIEGAGDKLLAGARAFFESRGWTRAEASGIVAGFHRESLLRPGAVGDGGHAYGIGQWHEDRQRNFERLFGHSIRGSNREEQLAFADWELHNTEARAGRHIRGAGSAYDAGAAASRFYERPADRDGEARFRGTSAERIARLPEIPVTVKVELVNAPRGTRASVKAGHRAAPAVSHAMQH